MARLRTFVALDLGDLIRGRLVDLQEKLAEPESEVKWVEEDNLHLTLLFLGEVDQRAIHDVCLAVNRAVRVVPAFTIAVEGVGCFPNIRRPRVLWAGVSTGAENVIALHEALEPSLLELGCYRREDRKFTPHVTLGRLRGSEPPPHLEKKLARNESFHGGETTVEKVHVMASELTPQGPRYTVLSRAPLHHRDETD